MPAAVFGTQILEEGDILLLDDSHPWTNSTGAHSAIRLGQAIKGSELGESKLVHAVMWTKQAAGRMPMAPSSGIVFGNPADQAQHNADVAASPHTEEISEASGAHGVRNHWLRAGGYYAFTLRDDQRGLGVRAAEIARRWGSTGAISYSQMEALSSVVPGNSVHDAGRAMENARRYAAGAFHSLPDWARLPEHERTGRDMFVEGNFGNAYCSQFIIACYQAASLTSGVPLEGVAALHARVANVRHLHDALQGDRRFVHQFNVCIQQTVHDGQ